MTGTRNDTDTAVDFLRRYGIHDRRSWLRAIENHPLRSPDILIEDVAGAARLDDPGITQESITAQIDLYREQHIDHWLSVVEWQTRRAGTVGRLASLSALRSAGWVGGVIPASELASIAADTQPDLASPWLRLPEVVAVYHLAVSRYIGLEDAGTTAEGVQFEQIHVDFGRDKPRSDR